MFVIKIGNFAVSEIIGAITLLAIAIVVFSVVYINVLSDDGPSPNAYTTIIGKTETGHPIFEFQRGEGVGLDSKVDFIIGETEYNSTFVSNLIETNDYSSNTWDIGNRLFCPFSEPGAEIKAYIYDSITNELVWYGILQEGVNLQDLGAIWRFNETQGSTAYDSLNDNDGTLHGPDWNTSVKWEGNSSLFFNGMDYVEVDGSSYSLNYIENLNITAYFKFPEDQFLTDFRFGVPFGYNPGIINIHDDVYAIAFYNKTRQKGMITTVKIFSNGSATAKNIFKNQEIIDTKCYWPRLCHVSDEVYIVGYKSQIVNPQNTTLKTFKILNNGTIYNLSGLISYGPNEINDYNFFKISENHTALVYRADNDSGMIKSYYITDYGNTISCNETYMFEENYCYEPDIIHIYGNIYAIVYGNNHKEGIIKTLNIMPDGSVHLPFIDSFIFDSINGASNPNIQRVSDNTYVISYSNDDGDNIGFITTIRITDSGYIVKEVIDTFNFEDYGKTCLKPKIIHMDKDYFVITYEGYKEKSNQGTYTIVKIGQYGLINHTFLITKKLNIDAEFGYEPDIIKVSENVFAIVFRSGTPHPGELRTFSIYNIIDNELQPNNCGIIYKQDTWSIYVKQSYVFVTINNIKNFTKPYNWSDDWNKLNLIYNGSHLELWCNEVRVINDNYIFDIYGTNIGKVIKIGERFQGYIDEVSILEK